MVGYQKPNWFHISYTIYFLVLSVVQYYILYLTDCFLILNSTLCSRVLCLNLLLVVLWDRTITGSGHTIFCASSQLGIYFTHLVPSTRMATLSGYVILYPCKFSLLNIRLFYVHILCELLNYVNNDGLFLQLYLFFIESKKSSELVAAGGHKGSWVGNHSRCLWKLTGLEVRK